MIVMFLIILLKPKTEMKMEWKRAMSCVNYVNKSRQMRNDIVDLKVYTQIDVCTLNIIILYQ